MRGPDVHPCGGVAPYLTRSCAARVTPDASRRARTRSVGTGRYVPRTPVPAARTGVGHAAGCGRRYRHHERRAVRRSANLCARVMLARQRAVLHMEWDDKGSAAHALVRGSGEAHYETLTHFAARGDRLELCCGDCTCSVGDDCEHVVAVALTAAGDGPASRAVVGPNPLSWERELDTLLVPAEPATGQRVAAPLAVELTLVLSPAPARSSLIPRLGPRLQARLVRPGRNGGWIAGGLAWSRLDSSYQLADCDPRHLRLLRELYALHTSAPERRATTTRPGRPRRSTSPHSTARLWPLLDEAAEIGLQLVHAAQTARGRSSRYSRRELCLDVTAGPIRRADHRAGAADRRRGEADHRHDPGPVHRRPGPRRRARVPDAAAARTDPADWRLRLARLATPAPPPLQRMVLEGSGCRCRQGSRPASATSSTRGCADSRRSRRPTDPSPRPPISAPDPGAAGDLRRRARR